MSHNAANIEIKCIDSTSNPYLVIGAIIAQGLAGLRHKENLPMPVNIDPAMLTKEQNKALGGINPLPSRLQESLDAFKSNAVLQDALGQALFETIIAIRLAECALFMKSTPAEIIAATCWQH